VLALTAAIPAVIPVKINVTAQAIVAYRLKQRLTAVTALTKIVTLTPTAMIRTVWMILHVHTVVTAYVIPMRISVDVLLTAELLL
jgi:hypothetical protein